MKYCSTRGLEAGLSFQDVLFAGYAKDEGLYMPERVPQVSGEELKALATASYPTLVFEITRRFISEEEISSPVLRDLINTSLKKLKFPEVVKIKNLGNNLNIAELFHGPTLAFKDLALSVVGELLNHFVKQNGQHVIILVGTSGDTGSSALMSVCGKENMDIVVCLPHGYCTRLQELQMTTIIADNVHVFRAEGNSDEIDEPIKRCFCDDELKSKYNIMSLNSINWGRIMVQVAHYFYCYYQLCHQVGEPVELVVPTGAAGNITAGCIAQRMGLPVRLVAAVNTNDIVARTLKSGDFAVGADVVRSLAPAMDIQIPYNVERLLYLFSCGNGNRVKAVMEEFERDGHVQIPEDIMSALKQTVIETFVVDDETIKATMRQVYDEKNYVVCPHTATAVAYHQNQGPGEVPRACLATAAPDKFPGAVKEAGLGEVKVDALQHLETMPTKSQWLKRDQDWYNILRSKVEEISSLRKTQSTSLEIKA